MGIYGNWIALVESVFTLGGDLIGSINAMPGS